jgi:hypothetical protein
MEALGTEQDYSVDAEADAGTRPNRSDYIAVSSQAPAEPDPYQEIPTVHKLIDQLDFLIFFLERKDEFYRYFIWQSSDAKYHKNVHDLVNNMFRKDHLGVDLTLPVLNSEQEFCLALVNACRKGNEKIMLPDEGYRSYEEALNAIKDAFAIFEKNKLGGITPWDIARMKTYLYRAKEITHFHFLRGNKESYYARLMFLKNTNDETGFKDLDSFYIPRLWLNRKTGQIHLDKTQAKVILKTGYGIKQKVIKEIYKIGAAIAVPIAPITLSAWNMADDYGPRAAGGVGTAMQLLTGTLVYFFMYLLLRNFFVKDHFLQNDKHSHPMKMLEKPGAKKPTPLLHTVPLVLEDDAEQRQLDAARRQEAELEAATKKALADRDPFQLTDTEDQGLLDAEARRGYAMPEQRADLLNLDNVPDQQLLAAQRALAGRQTAAPMGGASPMDRLLSHFAILAGNVKDMVAVAGHQIRLIPYSTNLQVNLTEDLNTIGGTKENAVEGANFRINKLNEELGSNIPANHPMRATVNELNALTAARPIEMQVVLNRVAAVEGWLVDQMLNPPVPEQPLELVVEGGPANNNNAPAGGYVSFQNPRGLGK